MNLPLPPTGWDIDRLTAERTEAVSAFGFTEHQARFLVEGLIHSGVFVERQCCAFAGITHGQKTHDFLRRLVERGYARPIATGALHRDRLFHVHHKPLYAAIGQADNLHRKRCPTTGTGSDADGADGGAIDGSGCRAGRSDVYVAGHGIRQAPTTSSVGTRAGWSCGSFRA